MSTQKTPTRQEKRDAARAERKQQEAAAAAAAARKRRLGILGGVLAAAVVVVVLAIVLSSSGGSKDAPAKAQAGESVGGQNDVAAMLGGVATTGFTIGKASAPVTVTEFADPQCPICKNFSENVQPQLVQDYIRTGKAKLVLNLFPFIGPDSSRGAQFVAAAARQNRAWATLDLIYRNQGEENSGYMTDAFLTKVGSGVKGLDVKAALAARTTSSVTNALATSQTAVSRYGVDSTPTILVGRGSAEPTKIVNPSEQQLAAAIDKASAK